jgi:hypothetical protein
VRNCGAIPDIFNALSAAQLDRVKGLLLGSLLHLISCGSSLPLSLLFPPFITFWDNINQMNFTERNLPAIRACGGIPIVLSFLGAKLLPIQVAAAQIIFHLAPSSNLLSLPIFPSCSYLPSFPHLRSFLLKFISFLFIYFL